MRFVDEARIKVKAGDGGPGVVAWRREKFVPLGGPAGGDGGKGGDVIFVAKEGMSSLLDLKQQTLISAQDGNKGQSKNKAGRKGEDRIVYVPVGTQITEISEHHSAQIDLTAHEQRIVICRGGDGGFGNAHFKSRLVKAPTKSTAGFKGQEKELCLTLKLMADVGLCGFPNAGKSTILARLSNAKPKIADYPFTTIRPMLGVCEIDLGRHLVVADIPGLIEGASLGQGLGFQFLQHLERVRVLCHVIDGTMKDELEKRFLTINHELKMYGDTLSSVPQVVLINKVDACDDLQKAAIDKFTDVLRAKNISVLIASAVTGEGLSQLKEHLYQMIYGKPIDNAERSTPSTSFDPTTKLY